MNGSVKRFLENMAKETVRGASSFVLCDKEEFIYHDKVQILSGFRSPATAKALFSISVVTDDKVADLSLLANILMSKKFPAVALRDCGLSTRDSSLNGDDAVRITVVVVRSREKVLDNGNFVKILEVSCEYPVLIVSDDQVFLELTNVLCEPSGGGF